MKKTVWHRATHDAGNYGSSLLRGVLGEGSKFSFPKSLYATRDAVAAVVRDRPDALIVDLFAGSGTTLNAVNLLNATDGGQRRLILVTNNEVSAEEAESLRARDSQPGDVEWEAQGICRSVTWPRSKYTTTKPMCVKLRVLEVGIDEEGEAIASCCIAPEEETGEALRRVIPPKSGNQKII